jgi:CRISPR-associated protein Csm2
MAGNSLHADLKSIVADGDSKTLVDRAKRVGEALADKELTTSQIRNVFGVVRQIEMHGYADPTQQRQLLLLKPKLAYAKGRESKREKREALEYLEAVLSPAIDLVQSEEHFRNFFDFFEAILAYHRAAGGKE